MADVWEEVGLSLSFTRPFNDWEVDEALSLLLVNQGKRIISSQEVLMFLKESSAGNFLVKSLYKVLDDSRDVAFPHRFIWNY